MFCIVEHFEIANFKAPPPKKELKTVKLYYTNPKYLMQKTNNLFIIPLIYIYTTLYMQEKVLSLHCNERILSFVVDSFKLLSQW